MPHPDRTLAGLRVLVTRPRPQGEHTAKAIFNRGGSATIFPVLEVEAPDDPEGLDAVLERLSDYDLIVMVSAAAVNSVVTRLEALDCRVPQGVQVAVTGPASARLCEASGLPVDFVPESRFDSEGLLETLQPHLDGLDRVLIFRGQSGRETLREELEAHGMEVRYQECYQRMLTSLPVSPIVEEWERDGFDVVLVTSSAIADGLVQLLDCGGLEILRETLAIAVSERVAQRCRSHGIQRVRVAASAVEESLIAELELAAQQDFIHDN